ncbi:hypothetical protein MKK84_11395 [Methylobacterium sp. E-065]|uniref:hypothetical protein n=1 Tax=Methylobacterium sp. E-065 TaxID=2836583 RepID=UPI001FB8F3BF|nr:hypothetical protein [Methylobacterium sp. E-065]MCJ2018024.1 hypothetical protein [Methylobacterium sp. E-065]
MAAARAIGRVLDRAGLGFTDLAAAIQTADFLAGEKIVPAPEQADVRPDEFSRRREKRCAGAPIPPFNVYAFRRAYTPRQEAEHRARVAFCRSRPWDLTEWERGFLNNVARLHGNLSIRQADKLAVMTDRLDMEVRRAC